MWVNDKAIIGLVDTKIVTRDYIIAEGSKTIFGNNSSEKSFYVPVFYLFKVHRNHPLRIFSTSTNHVIITPEEDFRKAKRMPIEMYKDRLAHDLTTFMMMPDFADDDRDNKAWNKFSLENSYTDLSGNKKPAHAFYADYTKYGGWIDNNDNLFRVSEVMPSRVLPTLFAWMRESHEIYSHEKGFNQKLEGVIKPEIEIARGITQKISNILEERYNTRLKFPKE